MDKLRIRPMRDDDTEYRLIDRWLSSVQVSEFYNTHPVGIDNIKKKYQSRVLGTSGIKCMIIEYNTWPIGYLQFYKMQYEDYEIDNLRDNLKQYNNIYAIDVFIGESGFICKGIGTKVMKLICKYIFNSRKCDLIIIDPNIYNKRAIRCYEKAGFKKLGVIKKRDYYKGTKADSVIMIKEPSFTKRVSSIHYI